MSFEPHVTVATVVEREGKFLFVEEGPIEATHLNQPAGHLEANESLIDAALRETLEETQWHVELQAYLGVASYKAPNGALYLRHSFSASALTIDTKAPRDSDIHNILWLTHEQALSRETQFRSPLVKLDLERHINGKQLPLSSVQTISF